MYLEKDTWTEYTTNEPTLIDNVSNEIIYYKTTKDQEVPAKLLPDDILNLPSGIQIWFMSKSNCYIAICKLQGI